MSSIRSRMFQFALRNRNLLQFKLKLKPEITADTDIVALRAKTEKPTSLFGKLPEGLKIRQAEIPGIYAEYLSPETPQPGKIVMYFHGGGYVLGSAQSHRIHVSKVVSGTNITALTFNYGLAPEDPFPKGLNDAMEVYKHLLNNGYRGEDIAFMGDSAGGGLALSTLNKLKDEKSELPACVVALSPWTDLKNTGESLTSNEDVDYLTWRESWTVFSDYYRKDEDAENPYISPLYGELSGLPPMQIFVGSDELLRDDSIRYAEKAKSAGVDVNLTIGEGLFHCYPVCSPIFPEATSAMKQLCDFIKNHLLK
ncbi:MAG: hydrolase [Melioribacteraceae bacterium]|nr:MAG: hydrolase [Melioribacteraceae bacterium]